MMKDLKTYLVTALVLLPIGAGIGWLINEAVSSPEIIRVPVIAWQEPLPPEIIETQETVYRDREVPVEKVIEKEVPVPQQYHDFTSLSEFTAWLDINISKWGVTGFDCDDHAEALQRKAYENGVIISCQLIENGRLFGKMVSDIREPHMGNLVMIGNGIYYFEPVMSEYRIVRVGARD